MLVYDVMYTSVTHVGLIHDVTQTDYPTQNGSAHYRVFATFKRRESFSSSSSFFFFLGGGGYVSFL